MAPRSRRDFVLYTHGRYSKRDLAFYRKLAKGKTTVAVDGGLRFFRQVGILPDILLGDFDSISKPRHLPGSVEVVEFPSAKDKTDTHLAVDLAIGRGAKQIDIVMPSSGEPDHMLGTLLLGFVDQAAQVRLRIVNRSYEIHPIVDDKLTIAHGKGDTVSLVPVSPRGRFSCSGVEFPATDVSLRLGDTLALRNKITAQRARFAVTGKALLIRNFSRTK